LVLQALTTSARAVFKELVNHQLKDPRSPGLSLHELFKRMRNNLSVTSEVALKGHIAEFVSHHLVRMRSGAGARQCYYCTLPLETMQQIVAVA